MFGKKGEFHNHTFLIRCFIDLEMIKLKVAEVVDLSLVTFSIYKQDKLEVDIVREIQELTYRRNPTDYTVFVIQASSITPQAQNALLKIIEEPPVGTIFIICTLEPTILPTVMSRSYEVIVENDRKNLFEPKDFLNKKISERLEIVTDILNRHKKDLVTRQEVIYTLGSLAEYLVQINRRDDAKRVFTMTQTLGISSGSLKQVLEGVSVLL